MTVGLGSAEAAAGPVLAIDDLSIWYRHARAWRPAVQSLSLAIGKGEAFGLVGESGSGKSSVAMAVLRYLPKQARSTASRLAFEGREISTLSPRDLRRLRGNQIAAVYQHPGSALNPTLTIGRQIAESVVEHRGASWSEARQRAEQLLASVRVRNPRAVLDLYPHELSGGMQQRATIAMAVALEPSLLVLDEPTTALDASVQAEIIAILADLRREHRTSLLLISHDIGLIQRATERVGVMQEGVLVEQGDTSIVLNRPQHPYTRGLIDSIPPWNFTKSQGRLRGPALDEEPDAAARSSARGPRAVALSSGNGLEIPALQCKRISQVFDGYKVLQDIDLDIAAGETYGLIGESGSGKSTLARIVTGLQRPTSGKVSLFGQVLPARVERRTLQHKRSLQMVFQSPDMTLNPRQRLGRILAQPLRRLAGLRGKAVASRLGALLEAVRLPGDFAAKRPASLSGGQRQRVAIARAFAGAPRLVVLDEPTSALDVSVQATILNLLNDLQRSNGTSFLFISHDLKVVRYMADRIGVLYRGHLVESGPADSVFDSPLHPYTKLLLSASLEGVGGSASMQGEALAEAAADQPGCAFAARCPLVEPRCLGEAPPRRAGGPDHHILCWLGVDRLVSRPETGDRSSLGLVRHG